MLVFCPESIRIVEQGASLPHRKLTAQQRAVTAANILDGFTLYQPTLKHLAKTLDVAPAYIRRARLLLPEARQAVLETGHRHPAISRKNGKSPKPLTNGNGEFATQSKPRILSPVASNGADQIRRIH